MTISKTSQEDAHAAWDVGDLRKAFQLFSKCAQEDESGCMLNLGYFYDEGIGIRKSKSQAMHWYRLAVRAGNIAAASSVAILYREKGRYRLSFQWFRRSARMGDGDAEVEIAKALAAGTGVRRSIAGARGALRRAISSKCITPLGREEAVSLLVATKSRALKHMPG
jgi:uncharacterized protein